MLQRDSNAYFDQYEAGRGDYRSHVYGEDSDYLYERRQTGPNSSASGAGARASVSGEIQSVHPMHLQNGRGARESHHVAQVRLDDGRDVFVDLGPEETIDEAGLRPGDTLRVDGQRGTISGHNVLFANRIEVNGKRIAIQRSANAGRLEFAGMLEDFHPIWVNDQYGNTHRLLEVSNARGVTRLIDLPADVSWRDLGLQVGARFDVRGSRENLGNQNALSADSVKVNGQEKLRWPRDVNQRS